MSRLKSLFKQFWDRRSDYLVPIFWSKVFRISRSNFLTKKISKNVFEDNLNKIRERPFALHFEVTNVCNSRCVFCAYRHMKRKKSFMPMNIYLKALRDYEEIGGGDVNFYCVVGDPLLDPKIMERIKIARGISNVGEINIITNGINFKDIDLKEFLTSGINGIYVSLADLDEEVYKSVYGVDRYRAVFEGLVSLLRLNKEMGKMVNITIGFRSSRPLNKIIHTKDFKEIVKYRPKFDFTWTYDNWVGLIKDEDLKGVMKLRTPPPKKESCFWFFDAPVIFENGDVGLCGCRDVEASSELIIGNIMKRHLIDIWRDKRVENIRTGFYTGSIPKICQDCSAYRNLDAYRTKGGTRRALETHKRFLSSKIYKKYG